MGVSGVCKDFMRCFLICKMPIRFQKGLGQDSLLNALQDFYR